MALDLTRSRRDIQGEPDEGEIKQLQATLSIIGEDLEQCQKLALEMGLSDKFGELGGTSLARFIRLFEHDCKTPMTEKNIAFHAEMRGRMSERLRLTLELSSVKNRVRILEKKKTRISKMLARLIKKGNEDD